MTTFWLATYGALWVLSLFLAVAVFTLARQVGLIHARLPPTGARMLPIGLKVGDEAPALHAVDLRGRPVSLGNAQGKQTLLVFVSPSCQVCGEVVPALQSIWHSDREHLDIIVLSVVDDEAQNQQFAVRHKLGRIPLVIAPAMRDVYRVGSTPYAVLIDEHGILRAHGIVNRLEHVDSILRTVELGYPNMESLMESRSNGHPDELNALSPHD